MDKNNLIDDTMCYEKYRTLCKIPEDILDKYVAEENVEMTVPSEGIVVPAGEDSGSDKKEVKKRGFRWVFPRVALTIGVGVACVCGLMSGKSSQSDAKPDISNTTSHVAEPTGTTDQDEEIESLAINCPTNVLFVEDEVSMYCDTGSWILESSPDLNWYSSDESIASVTQNGVVKGNSVGKATIHAVYKGIETERDILIVQVDDTSDLSITPDYDSIGLSASSETETINFTLEGNHPGELTAFCYTTSGLNVSCEFISWKDNIITMEISSYFLDGEGFVVLYLTPQGEEDNVVAMARVKVKVS